MKIQQHYAAFQPLIDYALYLERVMSFIPEPVTSGLGLVLLRDSSSLTRQEARKPLASDALVRQASGIYYRAQHGSPARIELFLDTITSMLPAWIVHVPMLRYEIVGRVFFHELGHHVFAKRHPTAPSNERAASAIGKSLFSSYLRSRYKWWLPIIHPIRWGYWLVSKLVARPTRG